MVFTPCVLFAQWSMGGRTIAMARTHTALPSDSWAVFHNPALIHQKERLFGLFAMRFYGLSELEDHAALISVPLTEFLQGKTFGTAAAAGIHSYGFDLYRETQLRIGGALQFDRFRLGMTANYVHLRIENYGSGGSPVFDGGLIIDLSHGFRAGYRLTNLFPAGSEATAIAHYPKEMSGGVSWNGISGLIIAADVVKDVLYPVSIRTAFETEVINGFQLRGGWSSRPYTWSVGTGFHLSGFRINLAVQKHPVLGLSPGMDCIFVF